MSRISVLMATYNGTRFLKEQLDSLRQQTRPADEVIICDDCSTDTTAMLVRNYIEEYNLAEKGWEFSINESNKGWRRNFLEAIAKTKGDIIFFCDQDDIWLPDKIASMAAIMEEDPQIQFLAGEKRYIDAQGEERHLRNAAEQNWTGALERIPLDTRINSRVYVGCSLCIRSEVTKWMEQIWVLLKMSDTAPKAHDMQALQLGALLGGAYRLDTPVLLYRIHESNASEPSFGVLEGRSSRQARMADFRTDIAWIQTLLACFTPLDETGRIILERILSSLRARLRFFETRNPFHGLSLLRYKDCYLSKKVIFGDIAYCYGFNRFAGEVYDGYRRLRNTHHKGKQA